VKAGAKNLCESPPVGTTDSQKHLTTVALRTYSGQDWSDKLTTSKQSLDNNRIAEFLPMVAKIAQRVVTYLKPPLSFEDLVSAGTIGLVKAARDYDPSRKADFKTYAYIRIKGAILDELRDWSFVPSDINKQINETREQSRRIIEQTGNPPTDEELAEKLGITVDKLYRTFECARVRQFTSIDGFEQENILSIGNTLAAAGTKAPNERIERTELIDKLAEAIQQLPEKQRQVILLYYQQNLTMKQTAEVFGITESRVSQLHASALFNLSAKLREWKNGR